MQPASSLRKKEKKKLPRGFLNCQTESRGEEEGRERENLMRKQAQSNSDNERGRSTVPTNI